MGRGALRCDVVGCWASSGEELAPLVAAKGFRGFEVEGSVGGREYVATVVLCPGHSERMDRDIAEGTASLFFDSFEGGRKREPQWKTAAPAAEGGTMKITIRHEPPDSVNAPGKTCVWIVGEDGETTQTEYLEPGQQTEIELNPTVTVAATQPAPIA